MSAAEDVRGRSHDGDVLASSLFYKHFDQAERVRWRMCDVAWDSIDKKTVDRAWIDVVRIAFESELTTFEATERFLKDWVGDVDFTQWLSIWLYEETKHPTVLLRWLATFDETVRAEEMVRSRATQPFVRSRLGTLCMNVMSELVASSLYVTLQRHSPEPVLRTIAGFLAGDEARHATHFFSYAKRMFDGETNVDARRRNQLDVLTVLEFWATSNKKVTHPVNQVFNRLRETEHIQRAVGPAVFDATLERATAKMFVLSSKLLGVRLSGISEVHARLGELWSL